MRFYLTKVQLYNDYEDKPQTDYSLKVGSSYADVVGQAAGDYRDIYGHDTIEAITIIPIGDDETKSLKISAEDYHKFIKEWAGVTD